MRAPLAAHLLPPADREAILGDLCEEAGFRGLTGTRRALWLARECGSIALGLSLDRARGWLAVPPAREVLAGLAIDGRCVLRHGSSGALLRALVFIGSVATLVLGVEVLVGALLAASGL
jgi:hypothetical protein